MACQVRHYKNLQITHLRTSLAAVWTNHIVIKNCFQQQDKSCRNAQRRRCLNKLDHIAKS